MLIEKKSGSVSKILGLGLLLFITPVLLFVFGLAFGVISLGNKIDDSDFSISGFGNCKDEILETFPSANEEFEAVVLLSSCGTASGSYISLKSANPELNLGKVILELDDSRDLNVNIEWQGNNSLTVFYHRAEETTETIDIGEDQEFIVSFEPNL